MLVFNLIFISFAQFTDSGSSNSTGNATLFSSNDGSLQARAEACTAASTTLRNDYINCFPSFPIFAVSTDAADSEAERFLSCLCSSSWRAGSPQIAFATVPFCPPIPPLSKGSMSSVIASCAPGNTIQEQSRSILSLGLRTIINDQYYVPLAGLPVGVTSGSKAIVMPFLIWFCAICTALFLI